MIISWRGNAEELIFDFIVIFSISLFIYLLSMFIIIILD